MLLFMACGCVSQKEEASGIKVVVTIAPLEEFVKAVGGDRVQVSVLVPPGAEPHTFDPTPSQMIQVSECDLYVKNGAGLEFWIDKVLQPGQNVTAIDSSRGIEVITEGGLVADPHIWLSLRNSAIQVENICQGLIEVDPANRDYYIRNRDDYLHNLRMLDEQFNRTFAASQKKTFIVHHPAWTYFASDYGLVQVPLMENEQEPGPRYLAEVIELAKEENITAIFVEPEYNPRAAEVMAEEMNAQIIFLDPLAGNYLENMRYAGQRIADSLA